MFAAAVEGVAARLNSKRVHEESARERVAWHDHALDCLKVLARFLLKGASAINANSPHSTEVSFRI